MNTVMDQLEERVMDVVAKSLNVDREKVLPSSHFVTDLGADSLDLAELVMELEEAFDCEISDEQASAIQTVGDALKFIRDGAAQ